MEILDMTPLAQVLVHFTNDDLALDTPEPMTGLDLDWILDSEILWVVNKHKLQGLESPPHLHELYLTCLGTDNS